MPFAGHGWHFCKRCLSFFRLVTSCQASLFAAALFLYLSFLKACVLCPDSCLWEQTLSDCLPLIISSASKLSCLLLPCCFLLFLENLKLSGPILVTFSSASVFPFVCGISSSLQLPSHFSCCCVASILVFGHFPFPPLCPHSPFVAVSWGSRATFLLSFVVLGFL